jgi:hypothetical protein
MGLVTSLQCGAIAGCYKALPGPSMGRRGLGGGHPGAGGRGPQHEHRAGGQQQHVAQHQLPDRLARTVRGDAEAAAVREVDALRGGDADRRQEDDQQAARDRGRLAPPEARHEHHADDELDPGQGDRQQVRGEEAEARAGAEHPVLVDDGRELPGLEDLLPAGVEVDGSHHEGEHPVQGRTAQERLHGSAPSFSG